MNKRYWILVAVLALIVAAPACGGGEGGDSDIESSAPDEIDAYVVCQMFIKDRLKAPSTADFPAATYADITQSGNLWTVDAWVDAENAFGARIRADFHCQVSYSNVKEEWTLVELDLED